MRFPNAGPIGRVAVLASLSAACSKTPPERAAGNASPVVIADPRPLNGMRGMTTSTADSAPGMLGMMNGLSPEMQSDLASVRGADEPTLHALLPHHRTMIESTLAQMNAEMSQMRMPRPTEWTALVDSI